MKLFLASDGNSSMEDINDFVEGLSEKKIAYIPTAANGEKWGSWRESRSLQELRRRNARIDIVQLEDYAKEDIRPYLAQKDIIWMAGGMCGYLMYWVRRVQLDMYIREILENTIYVGSSAGSIIAGASLAITEWYPGDQELGGSIFPTLHLVDFDTYPHYEEHMLPIIKERYKGKKLYLLKNSEAIVMDKDEVKIIGEERIITS